MKKPLRLLLGIALGLVIGLTSFSHVHSAETLIALGLGEENTIIPLEEQPFYDQLEIYEKIIKNKLSVRATEALVKKLNDPLSNSAPDSIPELPKHIKKGIKEISEYFGHKIDVKVSKNGRGKITIPFHSEEDFNRIKKLVRSAK